MINFTEVEAEKLFIFLQGPAVTDVRPPFALYNIQDYYYAGFSKSDSKQLLEGILKVGTLLFVFACLENITF